MAPYRVTVLRGSDSTVDACSSAVGSGAHRWAFVPAVTHRFCSHRHDRASREAIRRMPRSTSTSSTRLPRDESWRYSIRWHPIPLLAPPNRPTVP